MKEKEIKSGQYWLVKDGSIVFVLKKIEEEKDSPWWLVDKLDSKGDRIQDFPVVECSFEKKLSFQEVRELANKFFEKRVEGFFRPANESDSKPKLYLIQGVFFQKGSMLVNEKGFDGDESKIFKGQLPTFFFGYIYPDPESRSGLMKGEIKEWTAGFLRNTIYRESIIWDVMIDYKSIDFNKIYNGESNLIAYSFEKKEGNVWIGKYQVKDLVGDTKCVIIEVPEDFFQSSISKE